MVNEKTYKERYSKRLTSGVLGYPQRKRIKELTQICKGFPNRMTLDIGCNDLFFDKDIVPLQKTLIGCDLGWEDSLQRAKVNIKQYKWNNVDILQSIGEFLPLKDQTFELILSFETLEHVHDERQVINEINRVSKNNSHLVLAVPIEFGLVLLFKEFFRGLVAHKLYKGSWSQSVREARYSVKELFYAVCYRKTDKVVRIPHTHKGYDYRETLDLLNAHWRVISKINTPFNFLPDQLSYGCILVLKKMI